MNRVATVVQQDLLRPPTGEQPAVADDTSLADTEQVWYDLQTGVLVTVKPHQLTIIRSEDSGDLVIAANNSRAGHDSSHAGLRSKALNHRALLRVRHNPLARRIELEHVERKRRTVEQIPYSTASSGQRLMALFTACKELTWIRRERAPAWTRAFLPPLLVALAVIVVTGLLVGRAVEIDQLATSGLLHPASVTSRDALLQALGPSGTAVVGLTAVLITLFPLVRRVYRPPIIEELTAVHEDDEKTHEVRQP